jgi:predicted Zn finger-like uncharacterized protein
MRVTCPNCSTAYNIDDGKVPPGGAKLKCAKCQTMFPIGRSGATGAQQAIPLPGGRAPAASGAAIPLPGQAQASGPAIPLPGGRAQAVGPAIPLPGRAQASGPAIPLPGRATTVAIPLPAQLASAGGPAIPLPGRSNSPAIPLPGQQMSAIALPGASDLEADLGFGEPPPPPDFPSDNGQGDFQGGEFQGGNAQGGDFQGGDFQGGNFQEDPAAMEMAAAEADPGEALFGDLSSPPAPPQGQGDDLELAFGPGGEAPAPAPSWGAPQDSGSDLEADLGFGDPAPAPAQGSDGGDGFEFDPTAKPAPSGGGDGFEADLSAPSPSAAAPAPVEDLELLDFIDDAAADVRAKEGNKPVVARKATFDGFQVKTKQGKVLGPLPEGDVVRMLSDGRLLGNEDISQDGERWQPLGAHPTFAEALQKLMEAPAMAMPTAQSAGDDARQASLDANERLRQMYGDRMAGIKIVDSQESVDKMKKRIPLFAGLGVAALLFSYGAYQGLTPNGFFWYKRLFPVEVKPGDPNFQKLVEGRAGLQRGTHGSLVAAQTSSDEVLKLNDRVVGARALYAQAVFTLQARYGGVAAADIARAHGYVEDEWAVHKVPEVVLARASELLLTADVADMKPELDKLAADPEVGGLASLMLARSAQKAKEAAAAKAAFLAAETAGKVHGLAYLMHADYLSYLKDNTGAGAILEKGLAEDKAHPGLALALANLRVGVLGQPEKAEEVLGPILDAKELSAEERAQASALLGMVRVFQKKLPEAEDLFKKATALAPTSGTVKGLYASYLLRRHEYDAAEPLFVDAWAQHPENLDNLDGLINSMMGTGHLVQAAKALTEGDGKYPKHPRLFYLHGIVAEGAEKPEDAEKNYRASIQGDPKFTNADLALAQFLLRRHRLSDAKKVLEEALKKAPNSPELNTAWGDLAVAENRMDDAATIYAKAVELDSDAPLAHLGRARVLLAKEDLTTAKTEAELALKQDEKLVGTHRMLGMVLQQMKDLAKAKEELTLATKQDGRDAEAFLHLGEVLYAQGDYDAAYAALDIALTANKNNPEIPFYLSLTHAKRKESTQAIDSMQKAMERGGSTRADFHYQFGLIYRGIDGHYQDAIDEFKQALKIKPDYAEALEAMGDAQAENNEFLPAIERYEAAYNANSSLVELLGKIGDSQQKLGAHQKAIDAFRRHLAADPAATADYYKIGASYDELGKRQEAIKSYLEATKKDKENAMPWFRLGYDYKELGKNKDAVHALKEYLRLNPKADNLKEVQDDIEGMHGE